MNSQKIWKIITIIEIIAAAVVILLDLLIPTLIILGLIAVSLLIRHENISVLGFKSAGFGAGMV